MSAVGYRPRSHLRMLTAQESQVEREQLSFAATLLSEEGFGPQQWQSVDVRFTHRQMMLYRAGGAIEALTGFKNFNARLYSCPVQHCDDVYCVW